MLGELVEFDLLFVPSGEGGLEGMRVKVDEGIAQDEVVDDVIEVLGGDVVWLKVSKIAFGIANEQSGILLLFECREGERTAAAADACGM